MTQAASGRSNPFDMQNTEYGDMHRIIVQCMMSSGMLDAKRVKTVFTEALKYCGHTIEDNETIPMAFVQKTIREINEKINKYDLEIKSATCEITCKKYYVFIMSVEKPIIKLQKVYTPFEVELFQKIMDRILRKYKNFGVSMTECINITHEIEAHGHVSLLVSEAFIKQMLNLLYFSKILRKKNGEFDITLGPRSLREMEPILRDVYHDVIGECFICKQIMLHGYVCPNCETCIHRACYARYISNSSTCINSDCGIDWKPESIMKKRERDISDDTNDSNMPRLEPMREVRATNEAYSSGDGETTEGEESTGSSD